MNSLLCTTLNSHKILRRLVTETIIYENHLPWNLKNDVIWYVYFLSSIFIYLYYNNFFVNISITRYFIIKRLIVPVERNGCNINIPHRAAGAPVISKRSSIHRYRYNTYISTALIKWTVLRLQTHSIVPPPIFILAQRSYDTCRVSMNRLFQMFTLSIYLLYLTCPHHAWTYGKRKRLTQWSVGTNICAPTQAFVFRSGSVVYRSLFQLDEVAEPRSSLKLVKTRIRYLLRLIARSLHLNINQLYFDYPLWSITYSETMLLVFD